MPGQNNAISRRSLLKKSFIGATALVAAPSLKLSAAQNTAHPVRLGGPVFGKIDSPEAWANAVKKLGYGAAYCPLNAAAADDVVKAYAQAARKANIVIAEVDAKRYIKVNEAGPTISCEEQIVFFEYVDNLVQAGDIWALCGSLPPGLPLDFYAQLTELLHRAGAKVLLDTSGEAFRVGLSACPDLIKPNDVEAAAFFGEVIAGPEQAARAVDKFVEMGITLVALSLGAAGLMLASGSSRIWAKPPSVHVLNPVGAGDALVAGIVWAFAEGLSLAEIARWGVASGTAAAVREGVTVGTRREIETLYAQVRFATWPEDL